MDNRNSVAPVVTLGQWIVTLMVLAIPLVGFVMMLVWAFSNGTNPNKANLCKAYLIMTVVAIVCFMLFGGLAFLSAMGGASQAGM